MSKLFKLKEWLNVGDAAKRLSVLFGEDVTKTDVLRLALDGHLKLSINFVNEAKVRGGEIVSWNETEWAPFYLGGQDEKPAWWGRILSKKAAELPPKLAELLAEWKVDEILNDGDFHPGMMSIHIGGERFLNLYDEAKTIQGVWDLPMIGGEKLDIENVCQSTEGGPEVVLLHPDGVFVESQNGEICQLQQYFEDDEYQPGSRAQLRLLKQRISDDHIENEEALALLSQHSQERGKYFEKRKAFIEFDKLYDFHRAFYLPSDAMLVVRTEALRHFEATFVEQTEKPESPRKTENLLRTLSYLAEYAYGYDSESARSTAPQEIADGLSARGYSINQRTIREWLKEGASLLPPRTDKG
jgi:hypothetical protein